MAIDVRHQVFVSSTYTDLLAERRAVMEALLELDCIPAGMELFPATDEDSWTLIRQVIDESDYFVVIIGGRYGSVHGATGLSFTRMEYEYAEQSGKPIMGFLHRDPGQLPVALSDIAPQAREQLDAFREIVARRNCKYFVTPDELGGVVSRGLVKMRRDHPKPGWIRADKGGDLHLRERIVDLEGELVSLRSQAHQPVLPPTLPRGDKTVGLEGTRAGGRFDLQISRNSLASLMAAVALEPVGRDDFGHRLTMELRRSLGSDELNLTATSVTDVLVVMLADGVLEQRLYDFQLSSFGLRVAAELRST